MLILEKEKVDFIQLNLLKSLNRPDFRPKQPAAGALTHGLPPLMAVSPEPAPPQLLEVLVAKVAVLVAEVEVKPLQALIELILNVLDDLGEVLVQDQQLRVELLARVEGLH